MKQWTAKLLIICAAAALGVVAPRLARPATAAPNAAAAAQRRTPTPRRRAPARVSRPARPDYSQFSHAVAAHQKSCDSCHKFPSPNWKEVRPESDAFPDISEYPEHASCLSCHRAQFFARERPAPRICAVCHVGVTPRQTARWPFPSLPERYDATAKGKTKAPDFAVNFPHAKHEGLFGGHREEAPGRVRFVSAAYRPAPQDDPATQNAACATCHQTQQPQGDSDEEYVTPPPKGLAEDAYWPKKGTYKTAPRDHSSCFTCHSADAGLPPAPTDCATCHKLLPPEERARFSRAHDDFDPQLAAAVGVTDRPTLLRWSRRDVARFRHEFPPHDLACSSCHNVAAMDTAVEATKRVPVMSCGGEGSGCHVEPTGDGTLQLALAQKRESPSFQCVKCHVLNGRLPTPDSHVAAGAVKK